MKNLTFEEWQQQQIAFAVECGISEEEMDLSSIAYDVAGEDWANAVMTEARKGTQFDAATMADIETRAPRMAAQLRRQFAQFD